MDLTSLSIGQYTFVQNSFSFGLAVMAAATLFLWFSRSSVAPAYRMAITISGLVTAIAGYHYLQIMLSWQAAFSVSGDSISVTGSIFNQAYRYVDWLLTVPLLLVELILVMRLSRSETVSKSVSLGGAAALMIILGYPGEVAEDAGTRLTFWVLSMIPFIYIVYQLVVGLNSSIANQPEGVRGLIKGAATLVVISWLFYPVVFLFPLIGLTGGAAITAVEVGYTIADIVAKAVFGILILAIAIRKSQAESGSEA